MHDEKLKAILGANIAAYRKQQRLTQAGLAEKLNYSDKAVSKWERGESMPDVLTLVQLAELFGVNVNALLTDPNQLPEEKSVVVEKMEKAVEKTLKRKADKLSILGLSSILVWFVALLLFVIISSLGIGKSWIAFIYAIPANAIVLLSLLSAWQDFRWNKTLISVMMWGALLSLYASLLLFVRVNIWKLFLLGIPGQLAVILWFRLFRKSPKEENNG